MVLHLDTNGCTCTGLSRAEADLKPFIASMGIYVFKKDVLIKLLKSSYPKSNDFGGEIIPAAAATHPVMAYLFNDYWEDIGTIRSFFEANLSLAQQVATSLASKYIATLVLATLGCTLACNASEAVGGLIYGSDSIGAVKSVSACRHSTTMGPSDSIRHLS